MKRAALIILRAALGIWPPGSGRSVKISDIWKFSDYERR